MFIVAHHHVHDPEEFRRRGETLTQSLPSHLKLLMTLPTADPQTAFCLWEANSAEELQAFLDGPTEGIATNDYYPVIAEHAIGLPGLAVR